MIFGAQLARKALAGAKTQTRRPVLAGKRCRYRVHHTYAVQPGRGKPKLAYNAHLLTFCRWRDQLWAEIPAGEMAGELPGEAATDDPAPTVRMGRVAL